MYDKIFYINFLLDRNKILKDTSRSFLSKFTNSRFSDSKWSVIQRQVSGSMLTTGK